MLDFLPIKNPSEEHAQNLQAHDYYDFSTSQTYLLIGQELEINFKEKFQN